MSKRYRTKEETIEYFKELSHHFEVLAHRENDLVSRGRADAYEMAAFELKRNIDPYAITFNEDALNYLRTKFEITNKEELYDAVWEMINTYMEMD